MFHKPFNQPNHVKVNAVYLPILFLTQVYNFHTVWYGNTITGHHNQFSLISYISNNMVDEQTS
jgi:hypothetical protein